MKKHNVINYDVLRGAVAAKIMRVAKERGHTDVSDMLNKINTGEHRWQLCGNIFY